MEAMLKLLKESSPMLLFLAVLAYFAKVFIEKRLEGLAGRVEEIAKTSLEVKKELRSEERGELVALRVAIEKWEYFLETAVGDFTMMDPVKSLVTSLYEKDQELFLDVRIEVVKVCTYLRNRELEQELMSAIVNIRKVCYPLISDVMPKLIDLQGQLRLIENKLNAFQQSGTKDPINVPTEQDKEESLRLQSMITAELARHSETLVKQYRSIALQMNDLKEAINSYIYRPIEKTAIDKE